MAKDASYNVPYRRRREGKTDYQLRERLISSGLPRIVARKTLKHFVVQVLEPRASGDKVVVSAYSGELAKRYGWPGSLNNIPAAYLTGFLCGQRSAARDVKKAVLDIGLQSPSKGSGVFAVLRGFLDAKVEVQHNEEVLPNEKTIAGKHISDYAAKLSADQETYSRMFSDYLSKGFPPQKISESFSLAKKKILEEFKKPSSKA